MAEVGLIPCFANIQLALEMLSGQYGSPIAADRIAHGLPLNNGKISQFHLREAALRARLAARNVSIFAASSIHCPLLLFHPDGRATIISKIMPGAVGIAVGSRGSSTSITLARLQNEGFSTCWSISPHETRYSGEDNVSGEPRRHWIINTLLMKRSIVSSALFATIATNVLALAVPLITMNILDRVVSHAAFETLWALAIGGFLAVAGEFALRNLRGKLIDEASAQGDVVALNRIMAHILGARLETKRSSIGIQSNSLREFESLREIFNSATLAAIGDLPFAILFLVVIYMVAGPLVMVPIALIPILLMVGGKTQMSLQGLASKQFNDVAQKNAVAVELLSQLETIKAHTAESWAASKWERSVATHLRHSLSIRWEMALSNNLILALQSLTTITILVVGVYMIAAGQVSVGALYATSMLAGRALSPIVQVAALLSKVHHAMSAFKSIKALVDVEQERPNGVELVACAPVFSQIKLENVDFCYGPNSPLALRGVSLRITKGERIGIVGSIGSGKSSLVRIILGLRAPTSGSITLDGLPLWQHEIFEYRKKFGTALRESGFFQGTVRENISFHCPSVDDAHIQACANMGCANSWIVQLPKGLGSSIGEAGQGLSSGQRQTLALSRAFVGNPEILVFDEPTSDIDAFTEQQFVENLRAIPADKTMIVVTHRPAILDICNRLIVVENGSIKMDGEKNIVLARLAENIQAERARGAAA